MPKTDLVGVLKATLAEIVMGGTLSYPELTDKVGTSDWQFALIDALDLMQEAEGGREAMFFLRCGHKIGLVRVTPDEFVIEGMTRRRRHLVNKATVGLKQARNVAQSPDLSPEYKAYLGAHAATLAVIASVGKKHNGFGTGNPRPLASGSPAPDWDGLKALYDDD